MRIITSMYIYIYVCIGMTVDAVAPHGPANGRLQKGEPCVFVRVCVCLGI